jgi:wyosine [tRNA(Phe)-imidazoG37] synthetase (radical SAM superfamily)
VGEPIIYSEREREREREIERDRERKRERERERERERHTHSRTQVRHCALSLVGEPIIYPEINRFIEMLHGEGI